MTSTRLLASILLLNLAMLLQAQNCPMITKSSLITDGCTLTAANGNCVVCPNEDITLSVDNGKNLPYNGEIRWYYSNTQGFNPYNNQGTLIGVTPIPPFDCAPAGGGVKFNEVMVFPSTNDDNFSGPTTGEWIELIGPPGTDIGCYLITDGDWVIVIPSGMSIPADGLFTIGFACCTPAAPDLNLSNCGGCTLGATPNNVLTLDNTGEYLILFDGNNYADNIRYGNPAANNVFPFGDLLSGFVLPTPNVIGCVQNPVLSWPTFETVGLAPIAGTSYERIPDQTGKFQNEPGHSFSECNEEKYPFPLQLTTTFNESFCGQTLYIKGIVNPFPNGCNKNAPDASTLEFKIQVSCPKKEIKDTLCYEDFREFNGTIYDISNPSGTELFEKASPHGCDSTVIVNLTFRQQVTAAIDFQADICAGDEISFPVTFTGQAPFTFTYAINGQVQLPVTTSSNPYLLKVKPSKNSYITLQTVNDRNCEGTVDGFAIISVNEALLLNRNGKRSVCQGDSVQVDFKFRGSTPFSFEYELNGAKSGKITTNDTTYKFKVQVTDTLIIKPLSFDDNTDCDGKLSGIDTIILLPSISVSQFQTNCINNDTEYTLSWVLNNPGKLANGVNGVNGSYAGNTFTSLPIPIGTPYQIMIFDSLACDTLTFQGKASCGCLTQVGSFDTQAASHCGDGDITFAPASGVTLDNDDALYYILSTQPAPLLGSVLFVGSSAQVSFLPGVLTYGQTYYVTAFVGNTTNGSPDLNDPCKSLSASKAVVFHALPSIDPLSPATVCNGDCLDVALILNGTPPFTFEYSLNGGSSQNVNAASASYAWNVCPQSGDNYQVLSVSDAYCSASVSQTLDLTVLDAVTTQITGTHCTTETVSINGKSYSAGNPTGTDVLDNAAANGCDSILVINLKFEAPDTTFLANQLCKGSSLTVNGTLYDENKPSGWEVITGAGTCDSIVRIDLSFADQVLGKLEDKLCSGKQISINGTVFDKNNPSGSILFPKGSQAGCDSLLQVNLSFVDPSVYNWQQQLCEGASLLINNKTYDQNNPSGQEILAGGDQNGCDSIINVNLQFVKAVSTNLSAVLCPGESLTVNQTIYDQTNPSGQEIFPNGSASGCDSIVNVSLSFQQISAEILVQNPACPGEESGSITLAAVNGGNPPYTLEVNGSAQTLPALPYTLSNLAPGAYSLNLSDADGCQFNYQANISTIPALQFTIGPDLVLEPGQTVTLQPIANFTIDSILWTPPLGLSCNNCVSPLLTAGSANTYTATAFAAGGCFISDTLLVAVLKQDGVFIPNAISNNGDGFNDRLMVFTQDPQALVSSYDIYDRWGGHVFSLRNVPANDPAFAWKGDSRGKALNNSVFIYVIEVKFSDGSKKRFTGDVVLLK